MPLLVQQQLHFEAAQYHFANSQVHLQMKVRLRQAIMQSLRVLGHSILVVMKPSSFNSDIEDTDYIRVLTHFISGLCIRKFGEQLGTLGPIMGLVCA